MLQLEKPDSIGNSNHPVLGELGPAVRALVSITGVKLRAACPVAGETSLCLIINRAMRSSSLRVCDFCGSSGKIPVYCRKAALYVNAGTLTSVQGAQGLGREGPRCGLVAFELRGSSV